MDQIRDSLGRLGELSNEELDQLTDGIVSAFESAEAEDLSQQTVDAMTELAAALDAVREEKSRREEQVRELSRLRDEAAARVRGAQETDTVAEDTSLDAAPVTEAAVDTPAETESNAVTELATDEAPAVEAEEAVAEAAELATETVAEAVVDAPVEAEAAAAATPEADAVEAAAELSTEETEVTEAVAEAVVADAGADTTTDETVEGEDSEAMTAAAEQGPEVQAPSDRRPKVEERSVATASVAIVAGADIPGVSAGSELPNMRAIAEAMTQRLHGMRRTSGGDGEQHTVASIVASFPEDRQLRSGAPEENAQKIDAVASPQAITAAGGYCAPVEVLYDIVGYGVTDRPVRDSLATFQADRGGIMWTTGPKLGDLDAAVSIWTKADDESATDGTPTKPCLRIVCGTPQTTYLDAVPVCLTIGNLMTRAYPELVQANNDLALVTQARLAEQRLLTKIGAASTDVTAASYLGAARDFLNQVDRAAVAYRNRRRMAPGETLRVIAPEWLAHLIRSDLVNEMPGNGRDENFALAASKLNSWFSVRNINVTWTIDGEAAVADPDGTGPLVASPAQIFGAQAAGALLDYPSSVVWYLFAEGTFLFLDGGTLDLGLVRDSTLNATNDYKMFVETFEGLAMRGHESLRVVSPLNDSGAVAGTVTPA